VTAAPVEPAARPRPEAPEDGAPPPAAADTATGALVCPDCGRANEAGRRFCGRCGASIGASVDTEAAANRTAEEAAGTVARALDVAEEAGRTDLRERLERTWKRLERTTVTVAVVGEFKTGKSSFVNALIGTTVCPSDDLLSTTATTLVGWGPAAEATVVLAPNGVEPDAAKEPGEPDEGGEREVGIPVSDIPRYAREGSDPETTRAVRLVEVRLNRRILESGLCLVDTPGFGGLESDMGDLILGALASSDAVLLVTDAFSELTAPEVDFLREASTRCSRLACVVTKIDLAPHWRTIVDRNVAHLRAAGFEIPVLAVSSFVRLRAASRSDTAMHRESQFPDLLRFIASDVMPAVRTAAATGAAGDVERLSSHLEVQLTAERDVLADPTRAPEALATIGRARQQAARLAAASANWQQTLRDGMLDLSADAQHDLQERMRGILEQADELIGRSDPKETGEQIVAWVRRQVAQQVVTAFDLLGTRTHDLVESVAAHFAADVPIELVDGAAAVPSRALSAAEFELRSGEVPARRGESVLTAARGTYSGATLVGFAANILALPFALPITLAVGAMLGRKAIRDDRKRQLENRRLEMRRAVQRYVGHVAPVADKELRDALRLTERRLRDTFQGLAQELTASADAALASVGRTTGLDDQARRERLESVDRQLGDVTSLRRRAAALAS
jgi:GTP-binding protein EngB required for normal cell division